MKNWTLYKKLLYMMFTVSTLVYFLIVLSQQQVFANMMNKALY